MMEAITQDSKELRQFVDMCFDPSSPVSEKTAEGSDTDAKGAEQMMAGVSLCGCIQTPSPVKVKMN